ncbi:MAG: DHHW family protein [Hespellia sp.]|nr:DHHW family protein [Hespellia sp.]
MSNIEKRRKKNKKIKKEFDKLTIRIFYGVLLFIGFMGLLIPIRPSKSELEKRTLTKFPKITAESFMSGEFFSDVSTWYADTFPFRETLLTANAKVEHLYGVQTEELHGTAVAADEIPDADAEIETKEEEEPAGPDATLHDQPEQAGTIYVVDNIGFELYGFSVDGANAYINVVNSTAEQLKGVADVYDILVPTSIAVNLDKENQEKIGSSNQGDAIDYVYGHLDKSVTSIPLLDILKKHNSEYLYFKTDHHWTADGAYYAYRELMKAKDMKAAPLTDYTKTEYGGFVGTFYTYSGQSEALKNNPDTVVTYTPQVNDMTYIDREGVEQTGNVIADPTDYSEENKYLAFIGGDEPYSKIENPNITDGSSCVVIKESYANACIPFLVNSYQTVHVVDYRYYGQNLLQLVKDNGIKDVIYLNNTHALLESATANMSRIISN